MGHQQFAVELAQGDKHTIEITITGYDLLVGADVSVLVKTNENDTDANALFSVASGDIAIDAANDKITITFQPVKTLSLAADEYWYGVKVTNDPKKSIIDAEPFILKPAVVKAEA